MHAVVPLKVVMQLAKESMKRSPPMVFKPVPGSLGPFSFSSPAFLNISKQNLRSRLEQHLFEHMFDHGTFSDFAVEFAHPVFPFSIRFDLHRAVVCQSPFFENILQKGHYAQVHCSDNNEDD